jgi:hypothetical protein
MAMNATAADRAETTNASRTALVARRADGGR